MAVNKALLPAQPVVLRPEQIPPLAVDLQEAARLVGVSDTHLEKQVKAGKLPVIRIGTRRLFRVASLDKWLQGLEQAGASTAPPPSDE